MENHQGQEQKKCLNTAQFCFGYEVFFLVSPFLPPFGGIATLCVTVDNFSKIILISNWSR